MKQKVGPLVRTAIATYLGLAIGYVSFAIVVLLAMIDDSLIEQNSGRNEVRVLFFFWLFVLIPILMGGLGLAWLVVLPTEKILRSYSASRSFYILAGGILAACSGYGILHLLLFEAGLIWDIRSGWWLIAPAVATVTTGLVIGDQLWKRRPLDGEPSSAPVS